jgi:hypothetical protein
MVLDLRKTNISLAVITTVLAVVISAVICFTKPSLLFWPAVTILAIIPAWLVYFIISERSYATVINRRWSWLGLLMTYCLVGWTDLCMSSSGYSLVFIIWWVGAIFYSFVFLLWFFVVCLQRTILYRLSLRWIIGLLICHIISRLLNIGDGGDSGGSSTFIERIFGNYNHSQLRTLTIPAFIVYALYFLSLPWFIKPYTEEEVEKV